MGVNRTRRQRGATRRMAATPMDDALASLVWARRLTLAGLWAERLAASFWPLWVIALLVLSALSFGVQDLGPLSWARTGLALAALAMLAALAHGLWRFRRPTAAEALARIDARLPGRPIAALSDTLALGDRDAGSRGLWQAHRARMAAQLGAARRVPPDLRLSQRDPFALRHVALTAAVMAALFGNPLRVAGIPGLAPGAAEAMPGGPAWEGWAQPPAYTGKPSIYLADVAGDVLELPEGTRIRIRLYGDAPPLHVEEDITGPPAPAHDGADVSGALPAARPANGPVASAAGPTEPSPAGGADESAGAEGFADMVVRQSGRLAIAGHGGREWQVAMIPDLAPSVEPVGEIGREADGRFRQAYHASDDYGVTSGHATITLDLASVPRDHGLAMAPEPVAPLTLDLPAAARGRGAAEDGVLIDDISTSLLANMPAHVVFTVADAVGQEGRSQPVAMVIPGRRFFDPAARGVAEMRRDILWNRANAPRSAAILKAMINRPEDLARASRAVRRTRVLVRELDRLAADGPMTDEARDTVAAEMWRIALMFEEGDLGSARDRLEHAQDRLEEAIRNGASKEEIDQLMKEMQQAMRDFTRELGREAARNPQAQVEGGQEITQEQLQQMLDEIQRLMEEGRTAEAMALMEQLRQLMENLQVTQGAGSGGEGGEPMEELGNTLRDQQGLSDDAWRNMQRGRPDDGGTQDGSDLASRQRELRERLDALQEQALPGDGREQGEAGRESLERAERAMREAEEALEQGDLSTALDRQAEAIEAMRQGLRDLADEEARDRREAGMEGERADSPDPNGSDPLGRETGQAARIGSDRNMAEGDPDRRAQELLDEIRRRAGEASRPEDERDYLRRLLELF